MKKIVLFSIILLSYCLTKAQSATMGQTEMAAVNYVYSYLQYNVTTTNIDSVTELQINNKVLVREVCLDNGVNVVLSGYLNCLPVLMYSTEGEHVLSDTANLPDGLKDFLENYCAAIEYAADSLINRQIHPEWLNLLSTSDKIVKPITRTQIGPLITSVWGQSSNNDGTCDGFNYLVPVNNSSCDCYKCAAGCTAVAMAQIMNYWKYPVYRSNQAYQYDWCNMPDELRKFYMANNITYFRPNFENELNAIARLIADCGIAMGMVDNNNYCFRDCQSFAWPIDARDALVNNFNYSPDAVRHLRSSYTTNNWKNKIIDNLENGWPVLYAGVKFAWKYKDKSAHSFVCDGYNEVTDKFHFNWGHTNKGLTIWCTINNIVEGEDRWTAFQRAVFDIYPAQNQDACEFTLKLEDYYSQQGSNAPAPYNNVPYVLPRLQSAAKTSNATWRTIPSGATTEYRAHKEVLLRDGFYAAEGSNFRAYTVPCYACGDPMENRSGDSPKDDVVTPPELKSLQQVEASPVKSGVTLFPNPVDGTFHLKLANTEESIQQVVVSNMLGVVVLRRDNMSDNAVDASSLKPGLYIVRTLTNTGKTYHTKFVKK